MVTDILTAIGEIFLSFAVGVLIMRLRLIDENDIGKLSRLIIDVIFPMTIFSSITRNLDPAAVAELWIMPLAGFSLMAAGGVLGWGFKRLMKSRDPLRRITFHHLCAINNYVFLPIIVISNIWGEKLLPLLFIMNIGSTLGFWTIGVGILSGGDRRRLLKNMATPCQFAVVLALIFAFGRIPVPALAAKFMHSTGACAVPLMLIIVGAAISGAGKYMLQNKTDAFYFALTRLVLIPAIMIFILKLLPLPPDVYRVIFVVALMPASASSAVITRRFGGSPEFAGQAIILSTILCAVSVPLWLMFI